MALLPQAQVPGDPPPDAMTAAERAAWRERVAEQDDPPGPEEWPGPDDALTAAGLGGVAEWREAAGAAALAAADAVRRGLPGGQPIRLKSRGPGHPGSARRAPGESCSRAAAVGAGMALDVMPGWPGLAQLADAAAGDDDRYAGASDDELAGAIAAWDRIEAHASARKHAAVAEFIRRRPEPGSAVEGAAAMPGAWDEFTTVELAAVLAESRGTAEGMLGLARDLASKLPGTMAAFRDRAVSRHEVHIIAAATAALDPKEAQAAEQMVLGRAARLTPGALRAAIMRAVREVAPDKPASAARRRPGTRGCSGGPRTPATRR